VALCLATAAALQFQAARGVRGSDQYWYVQDVETLGLRGSHLTNVVFPATLTWAPRRIPPPFIHNILPLYLVAPLVPALGAYKAWVLANALGLLAIAFCAALAVRRLTGSSGAAVAAACACISLPSSAWLTSQPLADMLVGAPVALAVLALARGRSLFHWLAATAFIGLAYLSRESFLLTLFLMPLAWLAASGLSRRAVGGAAAIALFAAAFVPVHGAWFPQNVPGCPVSLLLAAGSPGVGQAACYLPVTISPFPVGALLHKLAWNLIAEFGIPQIRTTIFYMPFDILAILTLALAARPKWRSSPFFRLACALILTHLATIEIYQNENRYLQPTLAAVVVGGMVWISERFSPSRRAWLAGSWTIVVIGGLVSAVALHRMAAEIPVAARAFADNKAYLARVPANEGVLVSGMIPHIDAEVAPRIALAAIPESVTPAFRAAMADLNVRWAFMEPNDPLLQAVRHDPDPFPRDSGASEPERLYRLRE
jgi:hypothetical protein